MWFVNSYTSKVIVWLAAALVPCNILWAGECGCGKRTPAPSKIHQYAAGCCCGNTECKCCHKVQKSHISACCKNQTRQTSSPQKSVSEICTCPGSKTPVSQTTLPESSQVKHSLGNANAVVGLAVITDLPDQWSSSTGIFPSYPATLQERLSNLCRLII
jgi:hypothetical protein